MSHLLLLFTEAWLLTCLIECPVMLLCSPRTKWVQAGLVGNTLTNPLLNLLLALIGTFCGRHGYYAALVIGEIGAVLLEMLLYYGFTNARLFKCGLISLSANALSFAVGLLVF